MIKMIKIIKIIEIIEIIKMIDKIETIEIIEMRVAGEGGGEFSRDVRCGRKEGNLRDEEKPRDAGGGEKRGGGGKWNYVSQQILLLCLVLMIIFADRNKHKPEKKMTIPTERINRLKTVLVKQKRWEELSLEHTL